MTPDTFRDTSRDPFRKHGIKHLSPSSIQLYRANPALWVGRYLLKWPSESGPKMICGSAVELGLEFALAHQDHRDDEPLQRALAAYDIECVKHNLTGPEATEVREEIAPMLEQALDAAAKWSPPDTYQESVSYTFDGLEVPVIGYIDWRFADCIRDLKTTRRLPSQASDDHIQQVALYAAATKLKKAEILYVTPKKFAAYGVSDNALADGLAALERTARNIRAMLASFDRAEDALAIFAPDFTDFRWTPTTIEMHRRAANGGHVIASRVNFNAAE